ncbi:MAG: hypothetical protein OXR72_11310 [Gemmatimonadota bacterium]|nr:hypothetical protein [Gemmatimonadota bacterium]
MDIDAKLIVGIVAAGATVLGSVLTITIGKYQERKRDNEATFRELKIKMYDEFLKTMFNLFRQTGQKETMENSNLEDFFRSWQRKLIFWAGPKALKTYIKWKRHLSTTANNPDANTFYYMSEFILSIRKDLGLSNKSLNRDILVYMILQNPELFLTLTSKNPNITFAEIANIEANLKNN